MTYADYWEAIAANLSARQVVEANALTTRSDVVAFLCQAHETVPNEPTWRTRAEAELVACLSPPLTPHTSKLVAGFLAPADWREAEPHIIAAEYLRKVARQVAILGMSLEAGAVPDSVVAEELTSLGEQIETASQAILAMGKGERS